MVYFHETNPHTFCQQPLIDRDFMGSEVNEQHKFKVKSPVVYLFMNSIWVNQYFFCSFCLFHSPCYPKLVQIGRWHNVKMTSVKWAHLHFSCFVNLIYSHTFDLKLLDKMWPLVHYWFISHDVALSRSWHYPEEMYPFEENVSRLKRN